jgi:hypothetical protein
MKTELGLLLIILGWLAQFLLMCKNRREISTWFAILYIAGCLLLSLDAFQNNMNFIFLLNLSCLLMALLVLVKKSRR